MISTNTVVRFDDAELLTALEGAPAEQLDALPFGIIGFDAEGVVRRYNRHEAQSALFRTQEVIGQHVFIELAPCLNNYMVAGRFEECVAQEQPLDETLPYVLTFRMRPTRVRMRLLWQPGCAMRYVVIQRSAGAAS